MPTGSPFDLNLDGTETLAEAERLVLLRLLATGVITEAQAQRVIDTHKAHQTPVLDILGALNYIDPADYAKSLGIITGLGSVSELLDSEYLALDPQFVRRFRPADLVRYLFCPLSGDKDLVVVLAVDPNEPKIDEYVHQVEPAAEVIATIGTERNVTRLVDRVFQDSLTFRATNDLRIRDPEESASQVFTTEQIIVFGFFAIALGISLIWHFWATMNLVMLTIGWIYLLAIAYKLVLSLVGLGHDRAIRVPPGQLAALRDADLPLYSILVPVFRETRVVPNLLKALGELDYPAEKLDVLLLMEADDTTTIEAARAAKPPSFFRFIYVPPSHPRTKPKACNYGLNFCRGEYVTIYDAEDYPESDQLKKALLAFRNGPPELICVQAALNYFNANENYLTRMFTLEYSYWFDYLLPGLYRLGLPIPLGGTSNHFRLDRLLELGGWDPYNVTEDADLGIRAVVHKYTVGIVESTTYEEANKDLGNWLRQRSRWIKGYMQTWLVHNRHPLRLLHQIGWKAWLSYQFFVGGTWFTFLVNPWLWLLFSFGILFPQLGLYRVFGGTASYLHMFNLLIGNLLGIYINMMAVSYRHLFSLTLYALTNPLYWMLHSISGYIALWQLFVNPFYWEKTEHGITSVAASGLVRGEEYVNGGKP